jgi:hypothetical protein
MATVYAASLAAIVLAGVSIWISTRRRRQNIEPAPVRPTSDVLIGAAYGLSPAAWSRLSDKDRRDLRENVTTAPHFQENQ